MGEVNGSTVSLFSHFNQRIEDALATLDERQLRVDREFQLHIEQLKTARVEMDQRLSTMNTAFPTKEVIGARLELIDKQLSRMTGYIVGAAAVAGFVVGLIQFLINLWAN